MSLSKAPSHWIERFVDRTIGCDLASYDRSAKFAAISFYNRAPWFILLRLVVGHMSLQGCDYKSQTGLTWSYHQSRVVAPPVVRDYMSNSYTISCSTSYKLSRLVVDRCTTNRRFLPRSPFAITCTIGGTK